MANEQNQAARGNRPVGPQLKQARESLGLSVAEVAEVQHLRPAIIHAIESGHYEQIDTELFLKGYIRAYARQVGLDGNALIADLNVELEPRRQELAQAKAANPLIDMERRRRKKRQVAKVALWLIALVILGLLVFSFIYSPSQLANLSGTSDDTTAPSALESDLPDAMNDSDSSLSPTNTEDAPEALVAPDVDTSSDDESQAVGSESSLAQLVKNPVVMTDNGESPVNTEQASQIADNRGRLEIEFIGDCWIQVRDINGRSLASGLKRQNDRVDLRTESDIRLVIGAANAIGIMRFEGAPVDLGSKGAVGNRAEFVLALN